MLRKIASFSASLPCQHPEHNPPTMLYLEPGVYEHQCPGCGDRSVFSVYGFSSTTGSPAGLPSHRHSAGGSS